LFPQEIVHNQLKLWDEKSKQSYLCIHKKYFCFVEVGQPVRHHSVGELLQPANKNIVVEIISSRYFTNLLLSIIYSFIFLSNIFFQKNFLT